MGFEDSIELRTQSMADPGKRQPSQQATAIDDNTYLRRLGKRALLTRNLGMVSVLGMTCSALATWEGLLTTAVPAFLNGGPAGCVWGFLLNWVGTASFYTVLAELSSMAPTAGGQYHWVAMLGPPSSVTFLAYLTAWLTTLAWQAASVVTGYSVATILQGMIALTHPDYVPQPYQTFLIMTASMLFAVGFNSVTTRALNKFEGLVLVVHLAGFFCVLIPLVYLAPHNDANFVFTTFLNEGGWSTQALSFFVGAPALASGLLGADVAIHMSEETKSAARVVPSALLGAVVINGALAFGLLIGLLFCLANIDDAIQASETLFYPFLDIFRSSVQSVPLAVAMAAVVLVMYVFASVSIYASASRILWSFARDKGLPFYRNLVKLTKDSLPITAVLTTMVISTLISLIVLGSALVLNNLLSLTISALYTSYLVCCVLLLWRRTTGAIRPLSEDSTEVIDSGRLTWGPWRVPEPFGTINNAFACVYTVFVLFWSFWSQDTPTTPQTANWSILVYGAVVIFAVGWYFLRARHYFKGPIRET